MGQRPSPLEPSLISDKLDGIIIVYYSVQSVDRVEAHDEAMPYG